LLELATRARMSQAGFLKLLLLRAGERAAIL
jgi:hypothetical protein